VLIDAGSRLTDCAPFRIVHARAQASPGQRRPLKYRVGQCFALPVTGAYFRCRIDEVAVDRASPTPYHIEYEPADPDGIGLHGGWVREDELMPADLAKVSDSTHTRTRTRCV